MTLRSRRSKNNCARPGRCARGAGGKCAAYLETLESRFLLSSTPSAFFPQFRQIAPADWPTAAILGATAAAANPATPLPVSLPSSLGIAHTTDVHLSSQPAAGSPGSGGLMAAQVRAAYGIDQVMFGAVTGDGTGQTIAIIDAYHLPTALNDLNQFDAAMGLPDLQAWSGTGNSTAWLRVVDQNGGTNYPSTQSGSSTWEMEESLDIQWAHAIAPGANILLVEASSAGDGNLISAAIGWARQQPGVAAVSMSFSQSESSGQTAYDSLFTSPGGHTGITFLAATGDTGSPSGYPAYSPNVVAVGGTTLAVDSSGNYISESGWSGSGGGLSTVYSQPSYQAGVVTQSTTARANPDVSMNADPNSGVWIYDSYDYPSSPWQVFGGTSLATPMWAGLMAIIDQGRVLSGQTPLDGATQTLPKLYALPASDFHDITTGSNGFAAGPGYDLVTGRGTPVANLLIQNMLAPASATPDVPTLDPSSQTGVSPTYTSLNNSTPSRSLTFDVGSTIAGATVAIYADNVLIGSAVATGTTTSVTTNGAYALSSGAHGITATQTQPGLSSSAATAALTLNVDTTPPSVAGQLPGGSAIAPQSTLQLTFNEAVNTPSFSLSDVTSFTNPSGASILNQITGYSWSAANNVLTLQFNAQSAVGSYQLVLGGPIVDLAGNVMTASYTASFTIISAIYAATMDTTPGWTFDAGSAWAWGVPQGSGGDPTSGHTGSNVVGYNLSGAYAQNAGPYYATTPAINCSNYQGMTLSFWRWLGVYSSAVASVQASPNGGATWTTLWSNSGTAVIDTAWSQQTFTLPSTFNGSSNVMFRWCMGPTGFSRRIYAGWNIDDVLLTGSSYASISGQVFVDANGNGTLDSGEAGLPGAAVFLDLNNSGAYAGPGTTTFNATNVPLGIPDNNLAGTTSIMTVANTTGAISQLAITFNITHTYDSDLSGYLIGPDGTQITLFSHVGVNGHNFSNTTLSDSATLSINSGAAPFAGTYSPSPGALGTFTGKAANGNWQFKVVDSVAQDVGTINSWSLAITTAGDPATTTDANGNYQFKVSPGTYTVRAVMPAGYVPVAGSSATVAATTTVTGQNFALFPNTFNSAGSGDGYFLTASAGKLLIYAGSTSQGAPAWQIAPALLASGLTFNFTGSNETLFADFSAGPPPGVNITLNAISGSGDGLTILGQGSGQTFTMTDYQIGPSAGGVISYNNIDTLDLKNCTVNYSGTLSTVPNLTIDSGCDFYWN